MKALLMAGAMALATTGAAFAGFHGPHGAPHYGPHEFHGGPHHWGGPYEYGHRYFWQDRWYGWGEGPCLRPDGYGGYVWICG